MREPDQRNVIDFFDWVEAPKPRSAEPVRRAAFRKSVSPCGRRITDDWPDSIPVTEAELDLFEVHFGALLDELLGSKN